jgi:hypothetical protein
MIFAIIPKNVEITNLEQLKKTKLSKKKFTFEENVERMVEILLNSSPYDYYATCGTWEFWESLDVFIIDGHKKRKLKRSCLTEYYDVDVPPVYDLAPSIRHQLKQQKVNFYSATLLFEFRKTVDDDDYYKPIYERIFIPARLLLFFLIKEKQADSSLSSLITLVS